MPDSLECKIRKNSPYTLKNEQKVSCWWSTQGHLGAVFCTQSLTLGFVLAESGIFCCINSRNRRDGTYKLILC